MLHVDSENTVWLSSFIYFAVESILVHTSCELLFGVFLTQYDVHWHVGAQR